MFRLVSRILVVAYIAVPIAAGVLVYGSVRTFVDTVSPVYETAADAIDDAAEALRDELDDLRDNFQPLVNAVNSIRSALNTVANFISNRVNAVIDFVNGFPGINIPSFGGINLPNIINLNFLSTISENVTEIGDNIGTMVQTTTQSLAAQVSQLGLALLLVIIWLALTQVLIIWAVIRNLWG
ncbi:MAG: hypothetical protein IPM16_10110 [Chloroflexi bacterium]|nr:hypothetical protein [Chloroflexota bacterium]